MVHCAPLDLTVNTARTTHSRRDPMVARTVAGERSSEVMRSDGMTGHVSRNLSRSPKSMTTSTMLIRTSMYDIRLMNARSAATRAALLPSISLW